MASPLVTRRNGKKQACEPCRRRKVACDHGYPVCGRCRRRPNGETTCYYLPPDHTWRPYQPTPIHQPVGTRSIADRSAEPSRQINGHVSPEDKLWSSPAARAPLGFFGPTSFSTAYLETETTLAVQVPSATPLAITSETTPTPPSSVEVQDMANIDQGASFLAARVLQAIPKESPTVTFFQPHIDPNDEWMRILGGRLLVSTWETFGHYLRDRENVTELRKLGGTICINTRKSLKEDQNDPRVWIESFSGPNLRWEAVGLIFICAAFGEISGSPSMDPSSRLNHYMECCSSCITLANMGGSSGSLMLFLLYKRSVLHACMHGETSLPYWKFHAETVAMLTFSGFHDDQSRSSSIALSEPTIAQEARRRVGCQVFIMDKFLSTLVGRPPLLTQRFCTMTLPLDLEDATLLSGRETFQDHVHRLGPDGWNTDGRFHSSSLLRVRMMVALIRDEILEIGLGHGGNHTIEDIIELRTKEQELYEQLPAHIASSPMFEETGDMDLRAMFPKLLIRLDHLLNMFLVERLLVRHGCSRSQLLRISFEMIVLTLHLWTEKRIRAEMQGEFKLLVMGYAAPAGAVLCMELIDPNPVEIAVEDEDIIAGETYSKSSIIQQLSLFMGYLRSSGPLQSSRSVASDIRGVIKRVLDHVLNARQPQTQMEVDSFDLAANWDSFAQFSPLDTMTWFSDGRI